MRISDWSSDVCSSDLTGATHVPAADYQALRPCPRPRVCYRPARPARACAAARDFVHPAGNTCGRGGIGRRAGFRYQYRKIWGFESLRPHHSAMQAGIMGRSAALGGVRYEILSKDKTKEMKNVEPPTEGRKGDKQKGREQC